MSEADQVLSVVDPPLDDIAALPVPVRQDLEQLFLVLSALPELAAAGFFLDLDLSRDRLTLGSGETARGHWSAINGKLVWSGYAHRSASIIAADVPEAARKTLQMVLVALTLRRRVQRKERLPGGA